MRGLDFLQEELACSHNPDRAMAKDMIGTDKDFLVACLDQESLHLSAPHNLGGSPSPRSTWTRTLDRQDSNA